MARQAGYLKLRGTTYSVVFSYPPALRQSIQDMGDADPGPSWAKTMGTGNRLEAEVLAQPFIRRHKERLLFHAVHASPKEMGSGEFEYDVEPDTNVLNPDGTTTIADERWIKTFSADRVLIKKVPNVRSFRFVPNAEGRKLPIYREVMGREVERKKALHKDVDAEIVDAYIEHAKLRKDDADGTRRTLADWKQVTDGKTFAQGDRDDAQALVDHLQEERDLSPARAKKLIAFIKAAINHEMETKTKAQQRVSWNPFVKLTIVGADNEGETERPPYSEAEIKLIKDNLHRFTDEERLLLVWHIASGIRQGGIYSIKSDEWEDGEDEAGTTFRTRAVRITKDKGKFGPRTLPIPQAVLDLRKADGTSLLPEKIEGPLFQAPLHSLIQEIGKKLKAIGAHEREGVCFYSGRHRAKDRMLNRSVNDEQRYAIMGHTRQGAHHRYGHGFNMFVLKPSIDKIGF